MTLLGSSLTLLQGAGKYVQKYLLGGSVYAKWVNVFLVAILESVFPLSGKWGSRFVDGRNQVAQGAQ